MKLIITIDVEEDNWASYSPTDYTVENVKKIPLLQRLFDDFNVKPTYLITYPVAKDKTAISILKEILEEDRCEIGTHCHPWNTPPFEEENNKENSMLCNLPEELQYKKISFLHDTIQNHFGAKPVSFRSGRWGYSPEVARCQYRLGYRIDTSITPYTDWTGSHGPDFSDITPRPFKFSIENTNEGSMNGDLIEVPATIGFLQNNFGLSNYILKRLKRKPIDRLRLVGLLHRLKLLNKVWLSPEVSDSKSMIKLTRCMMRKKYSLINMVFHSSSLKAGLTPFVKTKADEKRFYQHLKEFLTFTRDTGIESIRLSDAVDLI